MRTVTAPGRSPPGCPNSRPRTWRYPRLTWRAWPLSARDGHSAARGATSPAWWRGWIRPTATARTRAARIMKITEEAGEVAAACQRYGVPAWTEDDRGGRERFR